jgi:hypothetical protein
MPKPPPPLNENDPIHRFAARLRELRFSAGQPPVVLLGLKMHCHHSTVSRFLNGENLPTRGQLDEFVLACGGDKDEWRKTLAAAEKQRSRGLIWGLGEEDIDHRIRFLQSAGQEPSGNYVQGFRAKAVRSSLRIGLLGIYGSGKTMYMAALDTAAARARGGFSISGVGVPSEALLNEIPECDSYGGVSCFGSLLGQPCYWQHGPDRK